MTSPDTSAAEVVAWRWRGALCPWHVVSSEHEARDAYEIEPLVPKALLDASRAETAAANARAEAMKRERAYAMETVDLQGKEIGRLLAVLQREGSGLIQWQGRSEAAEAELRDIREALPAEYRMWDSLGNAIRALTEIEGNSK